MIIKRVILSVSAIFVLSLLIPSNVKALANPAAVNCTEKGFKLETRGPNASVGLGEGYCVFPDGSVCEEWSFEYGKCGQYWNIFNKKSGTLLVPAAILLAVFLIWKYKISK